MTISGTLMISTPEIIDEIQETIKHHRATWAFLFADSGLELLETINCGRKNYNNNLNC